MTWRTKEVRTVVRFINPDSGQSLSITVTGKFLEQLARETESLLKGQGYRTTSLTDRRHKRRGF